jgi:hypothetical protein
MGSFHAKPILGLAKHGQWTTTFLLYHSQGEQSTGTSVYMLLCLYERGIFIVRARPRHALVEKTRCSW